MVLGLQGCNTLSPLRIGGRSALSSRWCWCASWDRYGGADGRGAGGLGDGADSGDAGDEQIDRAERDGDQPVAYLVSRGIADLSFPLLTALFDVIGIWGLVVGVGLMGRAERSVFKRHRPEHEGHDIATGIFTRRWSSGLVVMWVCATRATTPSGWPPE